jgi:hypothetical protein
VPPNRPQFATPRLDPQPLRPGQLPVRHFYRSVKVVL